MNQINLIPSMSYRRVRYLTALMSLTELQSMKLLDYGSQ